MTITTPDARAAARLNAGPIRTRVSSQRWVRATASTVRARAVIREFLTERSPVSRRHRAGLVAKSWWISCRMEFGHTETEILSVLRAVINAPADQAGVVVEAGCWKGASTAKISLACQLTGRRLVVFDSFEGIPPNDEHHGTNIFGVTAGFASGDYQGSLAEVRANVSRFGAVELCSFEKGWFSDTMPSFSEPVICGYIDVDLASSTTDCLRGLMPHLTPGAMLFSQDGHLPLVLDVFRDSSLFDEFHLGYVPAFSGLGERKLVSVSRPNV